MIIDGLIRFFYTQVPPARFITKIALKKKYSTGDISQKYFNNFKNLLNQHSLSIANKTILEIGPGDSYQLALDAIANGAKHYFLIDKFPRMNANHHPQITWITGEAADLSNIADNSIDIIWSISVLEHVKNMAGAIKEMHRVLKPGGLNCHWIDLRDHYDFNKPLEFLKYGNNNWNKYLTKEGISYTNRLRACDYQRLFSNLFLIKELSVQYAQRPPSKIHRDFNHYSKNDLLSTGIKILNQKEKL